MEGGEKSGDYEWCLRSPFCFCFVINIHNLGNKQGTKIIAPVPTIYFIKYIVLAQLSIYYVVDH